MLDWFAPFPGNKPAVSVVFRDYMRKYWCTVFLFDWLSGCGVSRLWTSRYNYVSFWYNNAYMGNIYRADFKKVDGKWYVKTGVADCDMPDSTKQYRTAVLETKFDLTKTYSNMGTITDNDKVQLQGYDRFRYLDNVIIKIKRADDYEFTTIVSNIQPSGKNASYCYFTVISDNANNVYMIIIDINSKRYWVKAL